MLLFGWVQLSLHESREMALLSQEVTGEGEGPGPAEFCLKVMKF